MACPLLKSPPYRQKRQTGLHTQTHTQIFAYFPAFSASARIRALPLEVSVRGRLPRPGVT
jgi:hypothetical protein